MPVVSSSSFILGGVAYEFVTPPKPQRLHLVQSWEYPNWPRVEAAVGLVGV